jgi:predicted lipid-binding transport protein (Tim44 family)
MFGGLAGSWIGSMLFPHWGGMGGAGYGGGSLLGSIFTWLIIIGGIWFIFRLFSNRRSAAAAPYESTGMGFGGGMPPAPSLFGGGSGGYAAPQPARISVAASDYQQFEEILKGVQNAWSKADLSALRHFVTLEMLSYFSEQLSENESQGVTNHVDNVELIKGDVREAWDEGRMQYATALMQWRARDYTVRSGDAPGEAQMIVNGDPQRPVEVSEMWTFARSPDGRWLLSAIQQV